MQVEVTQADREAYLAMNMLPEFDAADVRAGRWDKVTGLQAFARHRIEAARDQADEIARLREALGKDRDRLNFLDECNRRLNARYGTNYGWKLILNHNVNRLFLGDHLDVDLNDSHGGNGKLPSCRAAIDKEMDRIAALQHKEPQG